MQSRQIISADLSFYLTQNGYISKDIKNKSKLLSTTSKPVV